jgi:hypothetical protein
MHNPRPRTKSGEDVFEKKQHENTLCRKKKKRKHESQPLQQWKSRRKNQG